jgi:hypothetical protein
VHAVVYSRIRPVFESGWGANVADFVADRHCQSHSLCLYVGRSGTLGCDVRPEEVRLSLPLIIAFA